MRLNCHIPLVDDMLRVHVFGPEDEIPEWAVAKITNPDVWETAPSATDPAASPALAPPPTSGKGSSVEAWRAYAAEAAEKAGVHIEFDEDATRSDIIDALESVGIRTE